MNDTTQKWTRRTDKLLASALILFLAITVLGAFARHLAIAAMVVSFQHIWLIGGALLLMPLAFRRRWIWFGLAVLATGTHAVSVLPIYRSPKQQIPTPSADGFRVITANLEGSNKEHAKVRELVVTHNPDLLFTQETYSEWKKKLDPLLEDHFPHRMTIHRFGIYSRWPVLNAKMVHLENIVRPAVRFDWDHPNGRITVLGVHPMTPRFKYWALRNEELEKIAALAAALPSPALVIGDLNTSLWDPAFSDFQQTINMEHARQGHGILPSYRKIDDTLGLHAQTYIGAPIDHVFFTRDFQCRRAAILHGIGSDHYPFEADLIHAKAP